MDIALIVSALTLGLGTSLHCLGMCGPIAFSLGLGGEKNIRFTLKNLSYQMGRVTTYAALGIIAGLIGKGISFAAPQQYLSIATGLLMILMVFMPKNLSTQTSNKWVGTLLIRLKSALGSFIQRKSISSLYITGILNGFLPCGMVYVALAGAVGVGNPIQSMLFMACFGLGTIPLMFLAVFFGSVLSIKARNKFLKLLPILTIIIAIFFILRGLELGIPFLSPSPTMLNTEAMHGHHH